MVGQGEMKAKSKDDRSPKHKKCKVSKEAIIKSDAEAEVVIVMAKPEVRPWGKAWTGPTRALPEAGEGSELSQALWSIAADLQGIQRAQEEITGSTEARQQAAEAQVEVSWKMALDMASMAYDLGVLVEGWHYLCTWEMGPVEGEIEVPAEPSKEEEEEEDEKDMTLKE